MCCASTVSCRQEFVQLQQAGGRRPDIAASRGRVPQHKLQPLGNRPHYFADTNSRASSKLHSGVVGFVNLLLTGIVVLTCDCCTHVRQANANFSGSWAELGFVNANPQLAHCWQMKASSPLLGSMASRIEMATIGTPTWQQKWPCKINDGSEPL